MIAFSAMNMAMLIVGIVIVVAAAAGVIYGVVTKGRWTDRGLMVRDGKKIRWGVSVQNISVFYREDLGMEWIGAWMDATRTLGAAIGHDPFIHPVAAPPDLDLERVRGVVLQDDNQADPKHGSTELRWDAAGYIIGAIVTFPEIGRAFDPGHLIRDEEDITAVALHECGHTLGLDHDDQQTRSFMAPAMHERPLEGQGISKYDAETLRRNYSG